MNQTIRIIGGKYRSKKISFPALDDLRPTPDRVRETLFNWLRHDIRTATCLDLFAGSGALGFEAFSRGAQTVTFVECSPVVCTSLKKQTQAFQSTQLNVIQTDATVFLAQTPLSFDIIFFDPPFSSFTHVEHLLKQPIANVLHPEGLLYLESPHSILLDEKIWKPLQQKQTGRVFYSLYRKRS